MSGSFDDVYARYGRQVHAYLARLTGDTGTAEDLCQETFLRYLKAEKELVEANGHLRGWLFRVATNVGIDHLRRRHGFSLGLDPSDAPGDVALESRDLGARIRAELERISPGLRGTFLLRAHHELPYAEVAKALGISERAAKERFRKVRDLLARRLAHLCEGDRS